MSSARAYCVGLYKTGTSSYSEAMRRLGRRDWHCPVDYLLELHAGRTTPGVWNGSRLWDGMSNANESRAEFARIDAEQPGSLFVLTTRAVDGWIRSIRAHMDPPRPWDARLQQAFDLRWELLFGVPCRPGAFEEGRFRRAFKDHNDEVLDYFGLRVLVLHLEQTPDKMGDLARAVDALPKPYPHERATQWRES